MELKIELGDELSHLEAQLRASVPQINKAVIRALRKTTKWLETHSKREIGIALSIPQRVISNRFFHEMQVKDGKRSVNVWFGLNPVSVSSLGRLSQNTIGAKAGKHQFVGSFVASMKSGHTGIFKRVYQGGGERSKRDDGQWTELPIEEESFEIESLAQPIIERYFARAEVRFKEILEKEVHYVLHVEGK